MRNVFVLQTATCWAVKIRKRRENAGDAHLLPAAGEAYARVRERDNMDVLCNMVVVFVRQTVVEGQKKEQKEMSVGWIEHPAPQIETPQ